MKKIITILMAVCLMVSLLGISALAAPEPQTRPALVDFNNETIGQNNNRYYTTNPATWYYLAGMADVKARETDAADRYVYVYGNANVRGAAGVKFNAFEYDTTVAAGESQPEKLVVSFETEIKAIGTREATIGGGNHFTIGTANASFLNYDAGNIANGINPGVAPFTKQAMYFNLATANSQITGISGTFQGYFATDFDNMSFLSAANNGEKLYYTVVLDHTRDADGKGNFIVYINGAKGGKHKFYAANVDSIDAFSFAVAKENAANLDNVRVYTVANEKVEVTGQSVAATEVPYTTDSVSINFSHEIIDAADRYISVKKGDTVLTEGLDYTLEHVASETGAKTNKTLKVNFAEELGYNTNYSVVASADYYGVDGNALGEETTLASFTTEAAPQINLSAFAIKKGVFGNVDIANISEALGSTVRVTTTATNVDVRGAAKGAVFFGVYKNDVLVSLAYVNKNFATDEADEISVNVKLPEATGSDTVAIKAFVCEGITNIAPYGSTIQVSTAD